MQPIDASSQYAEKLGQFFCSGQTHFIFHATLCTVSLKVPGVFRGQRRKKMISLRSATSLESSQQSALSKIGRQ